MYKTINGLKTNDFVDFVNDGNDYYKIDESNNKINNKVVLSINYQYKDLLREV